MSFHPRALTLPLTVLSKLKTPSLSSVHTQSKLNKPILLKMANKLKVHCHDGNTGLISSYGKLRFLMVLSTTDIN